MALLKRNQISTALKCYCSLNMPHGIIQMIIINNNLVTIFLKEE